MPAGVLVTLPPDGPVPVTDNAKVGNNAKFAVTVAVEVPTTKMHDPVPEQGPLHPTKDEVFVSGAAVSVTVSPACNDVLVQVPEVAPAVLVQLTPPVPDTVPVPAPLPATVSVVGLNVALTDCAAAMSTVQAPVPVHAPLQPAKADPAGAVGVRATDDPESKDALQVPPPELQLTIPAGELLTVPDPLPNAVTESAN